MPGATSIHCDQRRPLTANDHGRSHACASPNGPEDPPWRSNHRSQGGGARSPTMITAWFHRCPAQSVPPACGCAGPDTKRSPGCNRRSPDKRGGPWRSTKASAERTIRTRSSIQGHASPSPTKSPPTYGPRPQHPSRHLRWCAEREAVGHQSIPSHSARGEQQRHRTPASRTRAVPGSSLPEGCPPTEHRLRAPPMIERSASACPAVDPAGTSSPRPVTTLRSESVSTGHQPLSPQRHHSRSASDSHVHDRLKIGRSAVRPRPWPPPQTVPDLHRCTSVDGSLLWILLTFC
jgi:hypothetical protein